MTNNPLVALRNLVMRDNQTVGALDGTINHALTTLTGGGQQPAPQPAPAMAQPPQGPALEPPVASRGPAQAGGMVDDLYRSIGGALGITTAQTGDVTPQEHSAVESRLGAILNEVYDPSSAADADQRERVADLFTGLGVGFGQMSRGDAVDLSEIRASAERRQERNTALRLERARRSAAASYALEAGDEDMARAIAGGAADINTFLTARQMRQAEARANAGIVRQAQQAGYLADALEGVLPEQMVAAIRGGADPSTILRANEMSQAAEAAARTQERIEDQLSFVQTLQDQVGPVAMARADVMGEPPPAVDPIMTRALELAQIDGNARILAGGSLYDYMSEARQQVSALQEREPSSFTLGPGQTRFDAQGNPIASVAPEPPTPSAPEQTIARIMELGYTRGDAIRVQTGLNVFDNDGVLRDAITGETILPQTAGLSPAAPEPGAEAPAPAARAQAGPPRDTTGTSLFDRIGQTTGLLSAGAGVLESTLGQAFDASLFPERAQSIQELNTLRGVIVSAFRDSGRLLSQELALLLDEVAPGSSVWQSPGQLRAKIEAIDTELRIRLEEERNRAVDPGVPTREQTASANLARDIERVLDRLHRPSPTAAAPEPVESVIDVPAAVLRSPALVGAAERHGVTVEELWQFLSPEAREQLAGPDE